MPVSMGSGSSEPRRPCRRSKSRSRIAAGGASRTPCAPSRRRSNYGRCSTPSEAGVLANAFVRVIEDRLDTAGLDLNAKDALHALEAIQRVTIDLGTASIDRTSTPSAEQAGILAARKTESAPTPRAQ